MSRREPPAGPVEHDPEELARLATLVAHERPRPRAAFTEALDELVATRFAAPPRAARPARRSRWRRPLVPALAAVAAALLVGVVIAIGSGGGSHAGHPVGAQSAIGVATEPAPAPLSSAASGSAATPRAAAGGGAAGGAASSGSASSPSTTLAPASPRRVEQSSQLTLGTPAAHVGDIAQGVLGVVGRLDGIVDQSSIASSGPGASAQFALRFPSAQLAAALDALSRLPHARVVARVDDSQDVNQPYVSAGRRLATAQAERAGLLRALRAASSEADTNRLQARIASVDRTIASAERDRRALARRVDYSRVTFSVQSQHRGAVVPVAGGDRLTPGRALHDAGRVLTVTAGVVVIAAAALVPLAVLLALAWPVARALRRRRRDSMLDVV